jgi:hypothetical protein
MNKSIIFNFSIDVTAFNSAMRAFKNTLLSSDVSAALRRLEQERESQRWATDPLDLMDKIKGGTRHVRFAVASVFWGVARFCDRCSEILEG